MSTAPIWQRIVAGILLLAVLWFPLALPLLLAFPDVSPWLLVVPAALAAGFASWLIVRRKSSVRKSFALALSALVLLLVGLSYFMMRSTAPAPPELLPEFPWPPPAASTSYPLPKAIFKNYRTVGEAVTAILSALERNGYVERSFYRTKAGGVALITRLERINDDGSSFAEQERWPAFEQGHEIPYGGSWWTHSSLCLGITG